MVQTVGASAQSAHERAMRASVPEMATYLQDLFGQKLTALMVGSKDPKAVGKWARGEREPHPDAAEQLRTVFQVAEFLLQAESRQTVRAWFMGMNPQLGDRAPALVITENPAEVMQAARAFLAGG
jgi:hypothetical protein